MMEPSGIRLGCCDCTLIPLLTVLVIALGGWIMKRLTRYGAVIERVASEGANDTPLYARIIYNKDDVTAFWGAMDKDALAGERRFLLTDLVFPLWYGAAFAAAHVCLHGRTSTAVDVVPWLIPMFITVVADWTENVLHLWQFKRFRNGQDNAVSAGWIRVASIATDIKTLAFLGSVASIIALCHRSLPR